MDKRNAYLEIKRNTLKEYLLEHLRLNASADKYFFDLSMELYWFHDQANHYRQATDADTSVHPVHYRLATDPDMSVCPFFELIPPRADEEACLDFLIKTCFDSIVTDDNANSRIVTLGCGCANVEMALNAKLILKYCSSSLRYSSTPSKKGFFPFEFVLTDSSEAMLMEAAPRALLFSNIVTVYTVDFTKSLDIIPDYDGTNLYTLLGQTLGNFQEKQRKEILQNIYRKMRKGDMFLLGLKKHQEDEDAVTAPYKSDEARHFAFQPLAILGLSPEQVDYEVSYENNHVRCVFILREDHIFFQVMTKKSKGTRFRVAISKTFDEHEVEEMLGNVGLSVNMIYTKGSELMALATKPENS